MSGEHPRLYFDLASPYAYLAVSRAAEVLGEPVTLEPILLGAIFRARGSGSWAHTDARAAEMAEVEARAARYGLPLAWPEGWPANSLAAMRAATWARRQGRLDAFAAAVYAAATSPSSRCWPPAPSGRVSTRR
jgi:2-hydroxychromene-2-carboxylate isomerase